MRLFFSAFAVILFLCSASALRADSPATLDDYRRAVAQALALTQQANALPASERAPLLTRAADTLDAVRAVQTPSGASAPVDNAGLVSLVRDSSQTPQAIARLTALRDALSEPLVTVNPNDLAALGAILANPPFTQTATEDWLQSLLRALDEFLSRLFNNTAQGVFDARDIFVALAIVAVALVLFYFIRNLRRNLVPEEVLPAPLTEHDARTPAEAFDNAARFVNGGDFRSAVRQLYLAALLTLAQRGRIRFDPALTNREVLTQTAQDPRARAALQPIVETFDRVWYGFEPISGSEFDTFKLRVEQVREL